MEESYKSTFEKYDPNNSGYISLHDMTTILQKMGRPIDTPELKDLLTQVAGTGLEDSIPYDLFEPFMELTANTNCIFEDEMYLVFQHFDKDGDGYICPEELKDLFLSFGDEITEKDLTDMMTEADHDGDGKVSFSDFVKVMTHPRQHKHIETPSPKTKKCFTLEEAIPEEDPVVETREEEFERMKDDDTGDDAAFAKFFKNKSKRRQSCMPVVGNRKSSIVSIPTMPRMSIPKPRSRGSCPDIASLKGLDRPKTSKKRSSLSASASFLRGLFKKK